MRAFYAVLAVLGLGGTWWFNLQHRGGAGAFLGALFATPATSSITVDLLVVGVAASAFVVVEGRRLGMRRAWLLVPLSGLTALAFTVPLFLAWREHRLRAGSRAASPRGGQLLRPAGRRRR